MSTQDEHPKSERGWKRHLLGSGIPLEFEVARLLAAQDMVVDADFAFTRASGPDSAEGSVDLYSYIYEKFGKNDVAFKISLLIEAKYRSPHKTLLLLPMHNDFAPTLGFTTQSVDQFSGVHVNCESIYEFEDSLAYAYKGVEIYEGGAIEREFRHGIEQLRYAAPVLLRNEIDFSLEWSPADSVPIFISKILITNANIRLLNSNISLSEIESASSLSDISSQIHQAVMFSEYGPDYNDYVKSVFDSRTKSRSEDASGRLEVLQDEGKEITRYSDPTRLIRELSGGETSICRKLGTQFYVCDLEGLAPLIKSLRSACRSAYRTRTRADMFMKRVKSGTDGLDHRPEHIFTRP